MMDLVRFVLTNRCIVVSKSFAVLMAVCQHPLHCLLSLMRLCKKQLMPRIILSQCIRSQICTYFIYLLLIMFTFNPVQNQDGF